MESFRKFAKKVGDRLFCDFRNEFAFSIVISLNTQFLTELEEARQGKRNLFFPHMCERAKSSTKKGPETCLGNASLFLPFLPIFIDSIAHHWTPDDPENSCWQNGNAQPLTVFPIFEVGTKIMSTIRSFWNFAPQYFFKKCLENKNCDCFKSVDDFSRLF